MYTTKQQKEIALKSMAMKARFANIVRTSLFEFGRNEYQIKYKGKKKLTDKDKLELFDKFWNEYIAMDTELTDYKHKRQDKACIQKLREERQKNKV